MRVFAPNRARRLGKRRRRRRFGRAAEDLDLEQVLVLQHHLVSRRIDRHCAVLRIAIVDAPEWRARPHRPMLRRVDPRRRPGQRRPRRRRERLRPLLLRCCQRLERPDVHPKRHRHRIDRNVFCPREGALEGRFHLRRNRAHVAADVFDRHQPRGGVDDRRLHAQHVLIARPEHRQPYHDTEEQAKS